ncbi:Hypothetical predicted protein [Olea europaea subsp. europaea]|uniref:PMI1/PMIR1-2 C-terminal domain-containing protein n=1 Tax=Olea europaea subsp. europaea TaxID=158383 RepID=A0A8S0QY35_OLEEU|nr:Hypothetical predicted protein [Olea europaea subsp. europaea]
MQVSDPVLLPAAMGFSIMEILQCWASEGVEKMSPLAKELMPMEDITGKTIQEVHSVPLGSCSNCMEIESDYVFYENLVDFTITNIETLLIEGLKIQCNMLIRKHLQALVKYAGKLASLAVVSSGLVVTHVAFTRKLFAVVSSVALWC